MSSDWRRTYILDGDPVPDGVLFVTCQTCGRIEYWHVRDVDAVTDTTAVEHFRVTGWTMNDRGFEAMCPKCQGAVVHVGAAGVGGGWVMMFRTGDTVRHNPSGEEWIVAVCEDGTVIPCGWPLSRADAADCELLEAASDGEHLFWLHDMAKVHGSDPRGIYARRILAERGDVRTRWAVSS